MVNSEIEEYGIYGGDQQFALSEGYADFFSAMTADDSPYGNDWLVGASCPIGTVRNMMNPPACGCGECPPEQSCAPGGDPDSFVNFIDVEQTHANAGIINKQNYLLAHDENPACVTHDQVEVCSIGTYDAEEMQYYIIQHDYLDHSADLLDYFYAMQSGAVALFGVPSYELTNTMRSLQAVGLWTKDYPASPTHDVDMAPDVAFFSETGNDMFMFYKKRSSNHILYRKYEGATASWGDAVDITTILSGAVTDNIPSAVEFNEDLYVFFKEDGQTAIQYVVMDSNETFDANVYTVPDGNCTYATATSDRVAVAEFDEKIYLVFRASNNYMRYRTMSAAGWNECATTTGYQTYVSPSAIGDWQDQLWIGYANSSYESRLLKLNSSGQKTAMVIPNSPNASKGIEVEIFKDELHVATVDGDGEIRYQRCSSPCTNTLVYPADGAHWSRLVKQHGGTLHRIAMTNYIGDYRLVMMGKDKTTGDTGYRYKISE